jgi:integrase
VKLQQAVRADLDRWAFAAAVKRAEVPKVRIHDPRHRRVTTWLAEGKPAALVQEAMGHDNARLLTPRAGASPGPR